MTFDFLSVVRMAGGLALFLYGMTIMGSGLERAAGPALERTLERMTGNLLSALLMGAAVTAVIQSSSATTVMVVGFVNAGILSLRQSVGVIMGANIGTTITAQILRLDAGGTMESSLLLQLIKPKNLAYLVVLGGVLLMLRGKTRRSRSAADIFLGFGILFIGMSTMEAAVAPLADLPQFSSLFAAISNPVLGVLVGAVVTAIIQSSSASVGILQALSTTGAITWSAAVPIILGQNIGTCITAFLSALGGSKNARRTAMVHFYFNLIGSIIFLLGFYTFQYTIGFPFFEEAIHKTGIANFHTIFNVVATILFLPFTGILVKLAERTIPAGTEAHDPLARLEPRFLAVPAVALEQAQRCIAEMGRAAQENVGLCMGALLDGAPLQEEVFAENEAFLDRAEVEIGKYLVSVRNDLPKGMRRMHAEMLHSLSDFEKIGDYAQNIFERAEGFRAQRLTFSGTAAAELRGMYAAVGEQLRLTVEGYTTRQAETAQQVEPLEETVDALKDLLKDRHLERLGGEACQIESGVVFLDVVHDLEKIGDHCSNIAIYTLQLCEGSEQFDTHSFSKRAYKSSEAFSQQVARCREKYLAPIEQLHS